MDISGLDLLSQMKLIKRALYSKKKEHCEKFDLLRYYLFPHVTQREFMILRYNLEKHYKYIEVFYFEDEEFWKLTEYGIRSTYNEGIRLNELRPEEIEEAVRDGEKEAFLENIKYKSSIEESVSVRYSVYEKRSRLIELRDKLLQRYWQLKTIDVENGSEAVNRYLQIKRYDKHLLPEGYIVYSGPFTIFMGPGLYPNERLMRCVTDNFILWYNIISLNELIDAVDNPDLSNKNNKKIKRGIIPIHLEITIDAKIVKILFDELSPMFTNRGKDLYAVLSGEKIATTLIFPRNQSILVELFRRVRYNGFIAESNTELNKWLCTYFEYIYKKGDLKEQRKLSSNTVKQLLDTGKGEPSGRSKRLLGNCELLPYKTPNTVKKR